MMHYGAILAKGEVGYTDLDKVLAALGNIQENYNWLLTDCECNVDIPELAVLSAFEKSVTKEQVLEYPLPAARDNRVQHPLATFEIVPIDSSYVVVFSREKEIVDRFRAYFPLSEELEAWWR